MKCPSLSAVLSAVGLCVAFQSTAAAQMVDFSTMKRMSKVAPIQSDAISLTGNAYEGSIDLAKSKLVHFEVTDPNALYEISLDGDGKTGLTLQALTLELNDQNQATKKTQLLVDAAFGMQDPIAALPPTLFAPGRIYLGLAANSAITATLRIERTPKAQEITTASGSSRAPTAVSNDVTGPANKKLKCLRPKAFDTPGAYDVLLVTEPLSTASLTFYSLKAKRLSSQYGKGGVRLRGVNARGDQKNVCIETAKSTETVAWRLITTPNTDDTFVGEPDAASVGADMAPLPLGTPLLAPLDKRDQDQYAVREPGLYTLAFRTNTNAKLCLFTDRSGGKDHQECYQKNQITIGPFAGGPKTRVYVNNPREQEGLYELTLTKADVDPKTTLLEPNYNARWQREYEGAVRLNGVLSGAGDVDSFTLNTGENAQMWRFVILGEGVKKAVFSSATETLADIRKRRKNARRLVTPDLYLDPGPVSVSLHGTGDFKVIAKPLGPPRPDSELEPNQKLPRRIAFKKEIVGTLPAADRDRFSFFLHREADIALNMTVPAGAQYTASIETYGTASKKDVDRMSIPAGTFSKVTRLPAGEHVLEITARKPSPAEYKVSVAYADPFQAAGSDAELTLQTEPAALQAYSVFAQQLTVPVTITNKTGAALEGNIETWSERPEVRGEAAKVSVPANGSVTHDVTVNVPPDLYDGVLALAFGLNVGGQATASLFTTVTVDAKAPAVSPRESLPAPVELVGGINVASSVLGAKWVAVPGYAIDKDGDYKRGNAARADNLHRIIDGVTVQGQPPVSHEGYLSIDRKDILSPVLDLAGDSAVTVAGIGIDTRMKSPTAIHQFAVDLSMDGATWQEALNAVHTSWGKTAYYVLPGGPTKAKFARLRALDRPRGPNTTVALNSFEVIAEPGNSGLTEIDIANRYLGALTTSVNHNRSKRHLFLDTDNTESWTLKTKANPSDINAAITFKNTLPADIAGVELVYGTGTKYDQYTFPKEAIVMASPKGPTGPWREVARKALPDAIGKGERVRIDFPEFVTAKALKVEYVHTTKTYVRIPAKIRVFERSESAEYRSVLGVWGEWATQRAAKKPATLAKEDDTTAILTLEANGEMAAQTVEFGKDDDTWRIAVPETSNTVRVSLTGSAGFDPAISAQDASGKALAPIETIQSEFLPDVTYVYPATPGSHVDVTIAEPQRSTVFLIDQSPSVAPFVPRIRRAIVDFASDMVKGRDAVHFKAIGKEWAREEWFSDPIPLRTALVRYQTGGNSSAETAIIRAADKLKDREGSRAIVVITDGDVDLQPKLMSTLDKTRARVFTIKISSGGMWQDPWLSQPLVQLWAGQTGGEVSPVLQSEDIAVAYARTSARLLGPKPYTIAAELETRVIDPGTLEVLALSADARTKSLDNLLIIFDASGSMLKRLDGTRRIKLAKGAVQGLFFEERLDSSQTKIGLRVFGGPPASCETKLVEPLSTNNMVTMAKAVNAINPQNNARTAIGASLLAAKKDLAQADGTSSILLITDGEETCDGDPLEAIATLREAGINTRIDVVSFALEPEIDRRTFESWAKAGGGIYADAQSAADLQKALATAVQARFDVVKDGEIIASGLTGGPKISLAPGQYTLRPSGGDGGKTITIRQNETTQTALN
jgi:Mg-chelatase subunit ChlD